MALPHAQPLDVIDAASPGSGAPASVSTSLLKTERLQLLRLVLTAGQPQPEHHVADECVVHCLQGQVDLVLPDTTRRLQAGQLMVVPAGLRHSLTTPDDCAVLVALLLQDGDAGDGGGGRGAVTLEKEEVSRDGAAGSPIASSASPASPASVDAAVASGNAAS